ncbi:hypothetical protein Tco_0679038 [Tanacetum coccineum]|uniref:Uncharacterized protein n=1 Tax=Tanacetum coccineum TaxID=301880 RepID=A0ABQ4XGR7_9ASTR
MKDFKGMSYDDIRLIFEKVWDQVHSFVPMDSEEEVQRLKRAGQDLMDIIVEALQTKYPIIGWEVYSEDTMQFWKIIRVGNHTEVYQVFEDMLKNFDRDDLVKLWSLVQERYNSSGLTEDKEIELWVELKMLFEPDAKNLLELQKYMHDPLKWWLYDMCAVHHVSTEKGQDIFMLVEKDYPLTKGLATLMLCNKLRVDQQTKLSTARPKLSTDSTKIERMKLEAMVEERRIFKCWFNYHITNGHQFTMSDKHQELSSLEQTTSGKDFSNPLMADSLPTTIWLSTHHALGLYLETTPEGGVLLGPERPRTYEDLSDTEKKRYDADQKQFGTMSKAFAGSELTKEDRESQLYNEFERFKMLPGENINEYYVRFYKLVNDMRNIKMTMPNIQLNSQFVNNMSPEWDRECAVLDYDSGHYSFLASEKGDVDDEPTAQTIFMANLSSAESANPQAGPSNASILSEVTTMPKRPKGTICMVMNFLILIMCGMIVPSSEEELELAEATRNKLHVKMNDSACVEKRVNITPPNYSKENFMATFTPQTQLTLEHYFGPLDPSKTI